MVDDSGTMEVAKANLVNLCDVGKILGLPFVFPTLESINAFMKFVQVKDVFVCDATIKIFHLLICIKCIVSPPVSPPFHSSSKSFLSLQMGLQTHLVKLLKIGSITYRMVQNT
jgi:hypothetical protein